MRRIWVSRGAHLPPELSEAIAHAGVEITAVGDDELGELAGIDGHQGIVAETTPLVAQGLEALLDHADLLVALDGVADPRNLGAVMRVVEAAGGDGVIVADRNRAPLSAAAQKAAAGAAEWLPVASVVNLANALIRAKDVGFWVVGLEAGAIPLQECALLEEKVVLVAGSEGKGLRRRVRESCDELVGIPLRGHVASLNVASAVAVAVIDAACRSARAERRGETGGHRSPV